MRWCLLVSTFPWYPHFDADDEDDADEDKKDNEHRMRWPPPTCVSCYPHFDAEDEDGNLSANVGG